MDIEPGYGDTPLEPEEADSPTPQAREILGDQPKKFELYETEQAINDDVSIALLDDIVGRPAGTFRHHHRCVPSRPAREALRRLVDVGRPVPNT